MDISQSKILVSVPTLTGYNTGATKKNIKNIRFDTDGAVDILDEAGTDHTLVWRVKDDITGVESFNVIAYGIRF